MVWELLWFLSSKVHDLSELESKVFVVLGFERLNSGGKVLCDLNSVEDNIFLDEAHMLEWVLSNFVNVVERGPVHWLVGDVLAVWQALLNASHSGNDRQDETNNVAHIVICDQ